MINLKIFIVVGSCQFKRFGEINTINIKGTTMGEGFKGVVLGEKDRRVDDSFDS